MILIDLNVLLDVIQERQPHCAGSSRVLERVVRKQVQAVVPAHAVTTIHYLVARYRDEAAAHAAVDWLLGHLDVVPIGRQELLRARSLNWCDFEDAVVAAAAESAGCRAIITRNVKDFLASPVTALLPEEYLAAA